MAATCGEEPMSLIEWSQSLELGVDTMDDTHRQFIGLLRALAEAADARMLEAFDALYAHTEAHFEQEQRWMRRMPFPPIHCHVAEHEGVLDVMREVRGHLESAHYDVGRVLARELAEWFKGHAATLDAMLAQVLRARGTVEEVD
jgi:hemerythrin-like metal-binding protein